MLYSENIKLELKINKEIWDFLRNQYNQHKYDSYFQILEVRVSIDKNTIELSPGNGLYYARSSKRE